VAAISTLPQVALAAIVNRPGQHLDEGFVRGTLAMVSASYGPLALLTALFAVILATFALNGGLRVRWVGWLAGLAAVLSLVGGCLAFFADTSGKQSPAAVLGLIGTLMVFLSVLVVSVDLFAAGPPEPV